LQVDIIQYKPRIVQEKNHQFNEDLYLYYIELRHKASDYHKMQNHGTFKMTSATIFKNKDA